MDLGQELEGIFDSAFETQVQESLLKCLFSSYKVSSSECKKKFPYEEEWHDVLPFYRWGQLRTELRGLGGRFKHIEATAEPNGIASNYHIIINSDRVMLTVSSVDRPGGYPRPATFRSDYANINEPDLFKPLPTYSKVYALLIHGVDRTDEDRRQPAFAQIVFPAPGFKSYIHKIDMFGRYSSLVKSLSIPIEERKEYIDPTRKEPMPQIIKKAVGDNL